MVVVWHELVVFLVDPVEIEERERKYYTDWIDVDSLLFDDAGSVVRVIFVPGRKRDQFKLDASSQRTIQSLIAANDDRLMSDGDVPSS